MDENKFWSNVNMSGGPHSCWKWLRGYHSNGYGAVHFEGINTRSHIVAWKLNHPREDIPFGSKILHTCDNRFCCNPDHLFLGTSKDNTDDMYSKGRGKAKRLSKLEVKEIIEKYSIGYWIGGKKIGGVSQYDLADEYEISQSTISSILSGKIKGL